MNGEIRARKSRSAFPASRKTMDTDSWDDVWAAAARDACNWKSLRRRRQQRQGAAAAAAATPATRVRKPRKKEQHKRSPLNPEEPDGSLKRWRFDPSKSPWWKLMNRRGVREPGTRAYLKFRRKFRLPLTEVEKLVKEAQSVPEWKDKPSGVGHGRGHGRHPLIIKVLAALRCLAKGVDVEEVEDGAQISQYTLALFVPAFVQWLSEVVGAREIRLPKGDHLDRSLHVYARLGYPGAYCETDGVHLAWDSCPAAHHALFNGKESYPTVAFNVSVLHSTEVIYIAPWCAGAKNDKTQAQHDYLFQRLRSGQIEPDRTYYLYSADGTAVECKGLYAIVDGGYHQWRILQCPLKAAAGEDAREWSERMESVRKAVERTFGILRKRFRILRVAFECQSPAQIEHTFRACVALHNILLRHDGRDTMGHYDTDWCTRGGDDMVAREDIWAERCKHVVRAPHNESSCNSQREPGHVTLREKLITHFGVARARYELAWPKTAAHARPRMPWSEAEANLGYFDDEEDEQPDIEQDAADGPTFASDAEDEADEGY